MTVTNKKGLEGMDPDTEIWSIWVNSSETTAYTARDNEVIVADISPKVTATLLPGLISVSEPI